MAPGGGRGGSGSRGEGTAVAAAAAGGGGSGAWRGWGASGTKEGRPGRGEGISGQSLVERACGPSSGRGNERCAVITHLSTLRWRLRG